MYSLCGFESYKSGYVSRFRLASRYHEAKCGRDVTVLHYNSLAGVMCVFLTDDALSVLPCDHVLDLKSSRVL